MKKAGKYIMWILGIITWLFVLSMFWVSDVYTNANTHQIIIIISGILLAIYIWKRTSSGTKELEKENQELKAEVQKLRQKLAEQAVQQAMDKAESREKKD